VRRYEGILAIYGVILAGGVETIMQEKFAIISPGLKTISIALSTL